VAHALLGAAFTLVSTFGFGRQRCSHECEHGTQECARHVFSGVSPRALPAGRGSVFSWFYCGPTGKVTGLAGTPLMVRTTGSAALVRANPGTTTLI